MSNIAHGDVDLIRVTEIPKTAVMQNIKNNHRNGTAIELGEHTGNAHVVTPTQNGTVNFYFDAVEMLQYVEVLNAPAVITHEEHSPLIIPIGIYKKKIETEYDPFTKIIKTVQD
jgi:hypothetical protein